MDTLSSDLIALVALTAMEIILGIDNIVFIVVLASRLPEAEQAKARRLGLLAAMVSRILLLLTINWVLNATLPLFELSSVTGIATEFFVDLKEVNEISLRDLIVFSGGLFLIAKSVQEIHHKFDGSQEKDRKRKPAGLLSIVLQIAVIDLVFSFDSVITAVGMANRIWVMVLAVLLAVAVMMIFADSVSRFVDRYPTIKLLALSFLILIGVMLIAESIGTHFDKGYVYFAMAFAMLVEYLNLAFRNRGEETRPPAEEATA